MTVHYFTELGYFSEYQCRVIKKHLQGYSFMRFDISWSNFAGNCTLIVCTKYECTEEELKNFFLGCALSKIFWPTQEEREY